MSRESKKAKKERLERIIAKRTAENEELYALAQTVCN